MSFFNEVDLALREGSPDKETGDFWIKVANDHFQDRIKYAELPYEVQVIISDIEDMYIEASRDCNGAEIEKKES